MRLLLKWHYFNIKVFEDFGEFSLLNVSFEFLICNGFTQKLSVATLTQTQKG